MPPSRLGVAPIVPVHELAIQPYRFKDLGPRLVLQEATVEMPILGHTFKTPSLAALRYLRSASLSESLAKQAVPHHLGDRLETARYGFTAAAPLADLTRRSGCTNLCVAALDETSPTRVRSFFGARDGCHSGGEKAADGIGALVELALRSDSTMMLAPSAIASIYLAGRPCRWRLRVPAHLRSQEQAVDSKAAEAGRLPVLVDVEQLGQVRRCR